jgi:hypothetical protein
MRLRDQDNQEIASAKRLTEQYGDGYSLYRVLGTEEGGEVGVGTIWLQTPDGEEVVLGDDDRVRAEADPEAYLREEIDWIIDNSTAIDTPEEALLERLAWGLVTPGQLALPEEDTTSPCVVLKVSQYYGPYSPMRFIMEDDLRDTPDGSDQAAHVFPGRAAAEAAIAVLEGDGPYYLAHGEAGRPAYYILPVPGTRG